MGRRGLHNEGSEKLRERLAGKVAMDLDTARRLFTLICAPAPAVLKRWSGFRTRCCSPATSTGCARRWRLRCCGVASAAGCLSTVAG